MFKRKTSIIVPCYNQAHFLDECLHSILNQTNTDWECIIVNDGSFDNTEQVAFKWIAKDDRFKYLKKQNGGLSSARNAGLEIATGEWIQFLDSDDCLDQTFLEKTLEVSMRANLDICITDFERFFDRFKHCIQHNYTFEEITTKEVFSKINCSDNIKYVISCNKIFKRKFFEKLKFTENIFHEDEQIIHHLYFQAQKIGIIHLPLYKYRFNNNSITNSRSQKNLKDALYIFNERIKFYKINKIDTNRDCDPTNRKFEYLLSIYSEQKALALPFIQLELHQILLNNKIKFQTRQKLKKILIDELILKKPRRFLHQFSFETLRRTTLIAAQEENPLIIPVIIINFNQKFYLEKLINFLIKRKFKNIVIVDNKSSFPPLLEYYKRVPEQVTVEFMDENLGHLAFFKNKVLQKKHGQGYYIVTDPDIIPNANLPDDFMDHLIKLLIENFNEVTKVGFALDISDIPDAFPYKQKVLEWESRFWKNEIKENYFKNIIDTTFALYKPQYPHRFSSIDFLSAIRIAGNFTAKHGGWYKDPSNLSEEEKFYEEHANNSASWKISNEHINDWTIK